MSTTPLEKLSKAVEDLQRQVTMLSERLARLEPAQEAVAEKAVMAGDAAAPREDSTRDDNEDLGPEILLAISAAVAAYLGERAHIRAIRLTGSTRWAQEGRASVQASHRLTRG